MYCFAYHTRKCNRSREGIRILSTEFQKFMWWTPMLWCDGTPLLFVTKMIYIGFIKTDCYFIDLCSWNSKFILSIMVLMTLQIHCLKVCLSYWFKVSDLIFTFCHFMSFICWNTHFWSFVLRFWLLIKSLITFHWIVGRRCRLRRLWVRSLSSADFTLNSLNSLLKRSAPTRHKQAFPKRGLGWTPGLCLGHLMVCWYSSFEHTA